jgi:eukaryotic-like serine/threonine-protein kinase
MSELPDSRISDLLERWEELYEKGELVSAESLCLDCPELVPELKRRIRALSEFERCIGPDPALAVDDSDQPRRVSPTSATCEVRYGDLRWHAEGGLGELYMAEGFDLKRRVALKFMKRGLNSDPIRRRRFLFEAEVTARLEHPGIVPVFGLGTDDSGRPCYAMRLIKGTSLQDAIDSFHAAGRADLDDRKHSLRKLLQRYVSVCNTLAYAHSQYVLHRDLKPKNVMLGPFDETLVVDWGLAKRFAADGSEHAVDRREAKNSDSADTSLTADVVGTPGYLSPEQARGEPPSPASDIYSLGAMLYDLLTGRPPVRGDNINDTLERTRRNEIAPARAVNPSVPRALEAICSKALATRPEDRYASALKLAADVDRWLADEPVSVLRDSSATRMLRWGRRNQAAVTGVVASVLAGLVGLVAVAGIQARANADLTKAKNATENALSEVREAKNRAEIALASAAESRFQAEAVNSLLIDSFTSPHPAQDGRQIKVVEVLDRAAAKLEKEFSGSEATRTALLDALSKTYQGLGLREHAVRLLEKVRASREATLGFDSAETLNTSSRLVYLYSVTDRVAEALKLGQTTYSLCMSKLGANHEVTIYCAHNLGYLLATTGRISEALPLLEGALKARESKLGARAYDTLTSRNDLANVYWAAGRLDAAVNMLEGTRALCEETLGPDHPDTLSCISNLAQAYGARGRPIDALALQEPLLKRRESRLGIAHPSTITDRNNLAGSYFAAGRIAEAVLLFEQTLELRKSTQGPTHEDTLGCRNNLAVAYESAGRIHDAIEIHEETLKLIEGTLGPYHRKTLNNRGNLGSAYLSAGRFADAVRMHEPTVQLCESHLGFDHPVTLANRVNLADAHVASGRICHAMPLQLETIGRCLSKLGPDHAYTLNSRKGLALAYESLGMWTSAETIRRETLDRRRKATGANNLFCFDDIAWLGRNLLTQAKNSEAETLLREGLLACDRAHPDEWRRFNIMSLLGGALCSLGRFADAEPLIVGGYEGLKARETRIAAPYRRFLAEAAERVVRLYELSGKSEQAKEWKAKLGLADLPFDLFANAE